MKIYEKINHLLKEKGWNLKTLHREIEGCFEKHAIDYRTLLRIIHGQANLRESTLFQIASALGTTPTEIRKGTDEEEKFIYFEYNNKAYFYFEKELNSLNFLVARLILLRGGKTEVLQDPAEKANFVKCLYGLQGETTCVLVGENGEEKHAIGENKTFFFPSTRPRYFENNSEKKSVCLLIQNPKYVFNPDVLV